MDERSGAGELLPDADTAAGAEESAGAAPTRVVTDVEEARAARNTEPEGTRIRKPKQERFEETGMERKSSRQENTVKSRGGRKTQMQATYLYFCVHSHVRLAHRGCHASSVSAGG